MLKLINVKRKNDIIEANYIPETSEEIGYIKMDLTSDEIIENHDTSFDKFLQTYLIQASYALKYIADKQPYEDEYVHMWY